MRIAAFVLLLACAAVACGADPPPTPETRVRAVIAALEAAAEMRDVSAMKEHVSESYRDATGRDKREAAGLVAMHFLRNQSVHVLTRTGDIELPAPDAARASVLVAMAGRPIPSPDLLPALRADLYRFEFELRDEDGVFRITSATWQPASLDEFR